MWHVDMNKLSYNFHNKCITNKLNSILNVNKWSVISYFSIAQLSEAITHEFHGYLWYVKLKCPRATKMIYHSYLKNLLRHICIWSLNK